MVDLQLLRRYPYFAGLGDDSLKKIAAISKEVSFGKGESLFKEGHPAEALYIVTNGHVDLTLELGSGKATVVDHTVPGDMMGWSVFVEPHRMRASATAREDSKAIAIDAEKLRTLCEEETEIGYKVIKQVTAALANRLKGAAAQIAAT